MDLPYFQFGMVHCLYLVYQGINVEAVEQTVYGLTTRMSHYTSRSDLQKQVWFTAIFVNHCTFILLKL